MLVNLLFGPRVEGLRIGGQRPLELRRGIVVGGNRVTHVDVVGGLLLGHFEFVKGHVVLRLRHEVVNLGHQVAGGHLLTLAHGYLHQHPRLLRRHLHFRVQREQAVGQRDRVGRPQHRQRQNEPQTSQQKHSQPHGNTSLHAETPRRQRLQNEKCEIAKVKFSFCILQFSFCIPLSASQRRKPSFPYFKNTGTISSTGRTRPRRAAARNPADGGRRRPGPSPWHRAEGRAGPPCRSPP